MKRTNKAGTAPKFSRQALGFMALGAVLFALMNFFARLATSSASWLTVGAALVVSGGLLVTVTRDAVER